MQLVIDGIVYESPFHRGIARIFDAILPRMCDLDDSLQVTVLTSARLRKVLPQHTHIRHRPLFPIASLLRPGRWWWRVLPAATGWGRRLQIRSVPGAIWHSTYYTLPPGRRRPIIITAYDMIHERFPALYAGPIQDSFREQKRRSILSADAVICISETTQRDVVEWTGIDAAKTRVVALAPSPAFRLLNPSDLPPPIFGRSFLLYVGLRHPYKNFERLLQAYGQWDGRNDIGLVVVGGPWSKSERRILVQLGIEERVRLLTHVDDAQLCILYNQAAALVYPSLYEGFGIPLLEATACGCPIVASCIPSTREVAGNYPVYFEPTDLESLKAAWGSALAEGRTPARQMLGRKIRARYSWDKAAAETLAIYRSVA